MPDHENPQITATTLKARLANNIWPLTVAAMMGALAISVLVDLALPGTWAATAALQGVAPPVVAALAVELVLAAAVTTAGVVLRPPRWSRLASIAVEQIGWILGTTGAVAVAAAVVIDDRPGTTATLIFALFIALGSGGQAWALGRLARKVRRKVEEQVDTGENLRIVRGE